MIIVYISAVNVDIIPQMSKHHSPLKPNEQYPIRNKQPSRQSHQRVAKLQRTARGAELLSNPVRDVRL